MWMGDFNCVLIMDERIGSPMRQNEVLEFRNCINHCEMSYTKFVGCFYTWNNKQDRDTRVFSKIDRVMCNEGDFVHCPMVLTTYVMHMKGRKPLKHFPMWRESA